MISKQQKNCKLNCHLYLKKGDRERKRKKKNNENKEKMKQI